jgi:hypothetical protein
VASAANDRLLYNMTQCCGIGGMDEGKSNPLTTADTVTAANQSSTGITLPAHSVFMLSPDGQLIADGTALKNGEGEAVVSISRVDGSNRHEVKREVWPLAFDPTGTKLVVGKSSGTSSCPGVCLMSLDGSTLTTLTTATTYATTSPDGTTLAWDALGTTSKTKKTNQLFVLKIGESKAKQITNFESKTTPVGVFGGEKFGPGNKIAFWGEPLATNELWTINADGTSLAKVPIGAGNLWFSWTPAGQLSVTKGSGVGCGLYTVNPDGSSYTRVPVSEESSCSKYPGFENGAVPKGMYRQPSTLVNHTDYLAGQYEPVLRFDSKERWRPLNLESFIGEEPQHFVCLELCQALTSLNQLNEYDSSEAFLNIAGDFEKGGDGEYHSPYGECITEILLDCNSGPRSAIYWRSAGIFGGYEYIDYWSFYRANDFYEGVDFHEGDWEGMTVAPSLTEGTFDYAAFSQHGTFYSYLRDVLRCEDAPSETIPEAGTCGTEEIHQGERVDDFVANGSQANYTTPCSEEKTPPAECSQNGAGIVERGYDGQVRWGRAFDDPATSLYEMPPNEETSWQYWFGRWGDYEASPRSPGLQSVEMSIECAHIDNESGICEPGPRVSSLSARSHLPAGNFASRSPGLSATSCGAWAGQGIGAVVCNPRELRRSVRSGKVGRREDLGIAVVGGRGVSASGSGVSQYANGGVVRRGTRLRLNGRLTKSTVVIVKVREPRRGWSSSWWVHPVRTGSKASAARLKGRTLRVRLKPDPQGKPQVYLGRFKARQIS